MSLDVLHFGDLSFQDVDDDATGFLNQLGVPMVEGGGRVKTLSPVVALAFAVVRSRRINP